MMVVLHKTVQDITKEILFELEQIIFPFTPFEVKGSKCSQLRLADLLLDDVEYLYEMLTWWVEDRENYQWEAKSNKYSHNTLRTLREIDIDSITLCSITDGQELDEEYYSDMLLSYIVKLGVIVTTMSEWMEFLLKKETLLLKSEEVHCSLGMFL